MNLEQGSAVRRIGTVEGMDEGQFVGVPGDMGKEIAHRRARLSVLAEFPRALEQVLRLAELQTRFVEGQRLAVILDELRLVVERVNRRRAAVHEQEDDTFHPRLVPGQWRRRRGANQLVSHRRKSESGGRRFQEVST